MKRDLELVMKILEFVEENSTLDQGVKVSLEGYDADQVDYHVLICEEAGFLVFSKRIMPGQGSVRVVPNPEFVGRLTWNGHDELSELRRQWRAT